MSELFGNETHCLVPSRFCDSLTDVWLRCLQFYPRRGTCKGQGLDVKRRCSEVILLHSNNHGRTRNLSNCQWVSSDICLVELNGVFLWLKKKKILLRIDPQLHETLRRMAEAEMRSVNGQIEFLLRKAIKDQRGD